MEEPVTIGLLLGAILSLVGPLLVRESVIKMDVFLSKLSTSKSALAGTAPLPLTPLLTLIVAVLSDPSDSEAILAVAVIFAVATLVGWPIAFVIGRRTVEKTRAQALAKLIAAE